MNWLKDLAGKVRFHEPLKRHTTFKIGGPAEYFAQPKDIEALKSLLRDAKRYNIPIRIIGRGSNILVNDQGTEAIVLRLNSPYFKRIFLQKNYLQAGSGASLNQLLKTAQKHGLSGGEFLTGIPGTLGGALVMNAGIKGKGITDLLEEVRVMDYCGRTKTLNKKDIKSGYRVSGLAKYIILSARLKLTKDEQRKIKERIDAYARYRKITQDLSRPSAGCIFKNPKGTSAGRLIDLCGLKGKSIGGARISKKHANFILNQNNATAADVLRLMNIIEEKVKKKFNLTLEPEIKIWQ